MKENDPQSQFSPGGRLGVGFFSVATLLVRQKTAALLGLALVVSAALCVLEPAGANPHGVPKPT